MFLNHNSSLLGNRLTGSIPKEIANISTLQSLWVSLIKEHFSISYTWNYYVIINFKSHVMELYFILRWAVSWRPINYLEIFLLSLGIYPKFKDCKHFNLFVIYMSLCSYPLASGSSKNFLCNKGQYLKSSWFPWLKFIMFVLIIYIQATFLQQFYRRVTWNIGQDHYIAGYVSLNFLLYYSMMTNLKNCFWTKSNHSSLSSLSLCSRIGDNQFSGKIPDFIQSLTSLQKLYEHSFIFILPVCFMFLLIESVCVISWSY